FRPPLPRIAGPHNLPTLLSTLPRHGQFSIVKPSNCKHPNRVFVVTRSKLKFSSISPAPAGAQVEALKAGGKVSAIQEEGKDKKVWVGANATEDGELRAHGKVWAMEFINGRLSKPRTPTKLPDPRIRDGLKHNWIAVDPQALPPSTKDAVLNWKKFQAEALAARDKVMEERSAATQVRRRERAVEKKEVKAKIAEHLAKLNHVEIKY
ncbi:hypothetical protein DB88DRAFT_485928, partial [Papiliotrema laurentii]